MTYILGIDPGLGGALALYPTKAEDTVLLMRGVVKQVGSPWLFDMPQSIDGGVAADDLASIVKDIAIVSARANQSLTAVVERVSSMPRQAGAFAFGLSTGIIHGCLASAGIPFELVSPNVWKAKMGLTKFPGETYVQNKIRARMLATQLFPALAAQFKRVKDDGRAEALLIAAYWANRGLPVK